MLNAVSEGTALDANSILFCGKRIIMSPLVSSYLDRTFPTTWCHKTTLLNARRRLFLKKFRICTYPIPEKLHFREKKVLSNSLGACQLYG